MLERSISSVETVASPVVIVLGHEADRIITEVFSTNTHARAPVVNQEWREGIASSIRCGVKTLLDELLAPRGDHGAKRIISADPSRVISIPLPQAAFAVDTPEQYQKVLPQVESATRSRRSK